MKLSKIVITRISRTNVAHSLMVSFVIFTSVGISMIALPVGFISLGVCSGLYGFLLGRD